MQPLVEPEHYGLPADELVMSSFVAQPAVRILGRRGSDIIEFTIPQE